MLVVGAPSTSVRRSLTPEARLALAATVTAVVIVADATAVRRPGTSIGDHLVGTTALLLTLATGAILLPRLPPGGRAVLGALLGALALELGVLQTLDGLAQDNLATVTVGVVALAAGALALATGAVLLWRSRRSDGSPARRLLRRLARAIVALIVVVEVVSPALFAVGIGLQPRGAVEAAPDLGGSYQDIRLRTRDGVTLAGWYVPSRNGAAVLVLPGRRESGTLPYARMLARHGYGVLLVDLRGTGASEGDPNAFGWGGAADVEAGLDYLGGRPEVRRGAIGGLGLSVGGELLLQVAATDPRVAAVVSEGAGYRTLHEARLQASLLEVPQLAVLFGALRVLAPAPPPGPLDELVGRISPRPVFLIEAGHGQGGETLNALYAARAAPPKLYWRIAQAHHTGGREARPVEYERRVVGFLDRALRPAR